MLYAILSEASHPVYNAYEKALHWSLIAHCAYKKLFVSAFANLEQKTKIFFAFVYLHFDRVGWDAE